MSSKKGCSFGPKVSPKKTSAKSAAIDEIKAAAAASAVDLRAVGLVTSIPETKGPPSALSLRNSQIRFRSTEPISLEFLYRVIKEVILPNQLSTAQMVALLSVGESASTPTFCSFYLALVFTETASADSVMSSLWQGRIDLANSLVGKTYSFQSEDLYNFTREAREAVYTEWFDSKLVQEVVKTCRVGKLGLRSVCLPTNLTCLLTGRVLLAGHARPFHGAFQLQQEHLPQVDGRESCVPDLR
jgi:hypothetical protein